MYNEIIGTYKIINTITNKYYYGSSKNIIKRFSKHKNQLNNNTHHCIYLQNAYNKYGLNSFEFIIDKQFCTKEEATIYEQNILDTCTNLYNISKTASGGDIITYHPNKEEILRKIKESVINRNKLLSPEEKKIKYGRKGEKNGMFGKTHTDEIKQLISNLHKGNSYCKGIKKSEETIKKMSEHASTRIGVKNPFFGKHHSDDTKKLMSEKRKGKKSSNARKVIVNNIEYESVTQLAKSENITPALVIYRIKKKFIWIQI